MLIEPQTHEAIEWLRNWNPDGPWNLVAIEPKNDGKHTPKIVGQTFTLDTFDKAAAWIDQYQNRWNLYFTVNLIKATNLNKSPSKDDIQSLYALHLDADITGQASEEERTQLLQDIEMLDPQPPLIIWSGGGYQAFWRLAETLPALHNDAKVESFNKDIENTITGKQQCFNINRLMRLPGTVNVLNAKKRKEGRTEELATVVKANWEGWHNRRISVYHDSVPSWPEDYKPHEDKVGEDQNLSALPPTLAKTIMTGDAAKWQGDRSKLIWHIVCTLVRLNWSDDKIEEVLTNTSYGCSAHVREQSKPEQYAKKQIRDARREVASDWERTLKGQIIFDSQRNVRRGLDLLNIKLSYNTFKNRANIITPHGKEMLGDAEVDRIWIDFDTNFGFRPQEKFFRTLIGVIAREHSYHPVLEYLNPLVWDGKPRINLWLTTYGGAPDNEYTRAVSRIILVAAVRRVRHPGCKFDEMLVLVNQTQGTDKSTAIRTLAVDDDWFSDDLPLRAKAQEVKEKLSGKWLIESSDLTGMRKSSIEHLKSFLSRQAEYARDAYGHFANEAPRQCVFFGTTNERHFLSDASNRRFWPVPVNRFNIQRLREDRDQLWAEAAHLEAQNTSIRLAPGLWNIAGEYQEHHRQEDSWTSALAIHLEPLAGRITIEDTYKILDLPPSRRIPEHGRRLTDAMRTLGWERDIQKVGQKVSRCFIKGDDTERTKTVFVHLDDFSKVYEVSHSNPSDKPKPYRYRSTNDGHDDAPF